MTTNTEFQDQGGTAPTTPPAAASDAAIALRGLAGVIRKHGTCAPMALEVIAERLEAAPPIAQQGGGEVTDAMVDVYQRCYMQNFVDGRMLKVPERIKRSIQAALAAQPAPVVGGSDWYAEQHARDSKELRKLCESRDFYKRRCEALQALQSNMRDPERKAVCDILANGTTTALSTRPAESVAQGGEEGVGYGIIDPDYARIFTIARVLCWSEGYALTMHGSFTRDLDLVAVPWTDRAREPEHLARRVLEACGLKDSHSNPGEKPHGRLVWTMRLPDFGDPRFVDFSIVPPTPTPTPATGSGGEAA